MSATPPKKPRNGARAVTFTAAALLAGAALRFTPALEDRRPAELFGGGVDSSEYAAPSEDEQTAVTDAGPTPVELALADTAAAAADASLQQAAAQAGSQGLGRRERGASATLDTVAVAGTIRSSLYQAIDGAAPSLPRAARHRLAWTLADIFEYRIDMSRDLQRGDRFRVLVERSVAPNGAVTLGRVLAASFDLQENEVEAVRFTSRAASGDFFDGTGKSLRAAFLRAPVEFRRISSGFGLRLHPILGVWKKHKGTDYAAPRGTPVRAIGDGVVTFAGRKAGYGNVVDVRHRNGYVSRYGHLRGFARGVRRGSRVTVGQTIAYVGMTGLATAPHLHFEMLMAGVQRDPRVALRQLKGGEPIPARERSAFDRVRGQLFASLSKRVVAPRAVMTE